MELQHLFVCLFAFISSSLSYQLRHLPNPARHSGAGRSQPSRPPPFCALPATPNSLHLFQLRNELPGVHMTRAQAGAQAGEGVRGGRSPAWRRLVRIPSYRAASGLSRRSLPLICCPHPGRPAHTARRWRPPPGPHAAPVSCSVCLLHNRFICSSKRPAMPRPTASVTEHSLPP